MVTDQLRRIAVTGAAGFLGRALTARLSSAPGVECVLAIDVHPNPAITQPPPNVRWATKDVREPFDGLLRDHAIQAVVHLAYVLRPSHDRRRVRAINVGGTENLLRACRAAGVRAVVYPSSTTVYGAHPSYRRPYLETDPVNPVRGFQYSEDKVLAERLLLRFASEPGSSSGTRVGIMRAPPVMGPSAENFIVRSLTRRVLPSPMGANVEFQFLHIDDLLDGLVVMLMTGASGVYNVAGRGTVRWREMVRVFGNTVIPVPGPLLKSVVGLSWMLRLQSESPACGVDFIRYPWLADTAKAERDLGWQPRYTSPEALIAARPATGVPQ
jgi:UDP-glucose 4-epimerase